MGRVSWMIQVCTIMTVAKAAGKGGTQVREGEKLLLAALKLSLKKPCH